MARYDLSDFEWSVIDAVLPRKSRGVPRVDDRRVLNGIFWVLRSGAPGPICRNATGLTPPATIASVAGRRLASGTGSWMPLRPRMTATFR